MTAFGCPEARLFFVFFSAERERVAERGTVGCSISIAAVLPVMTAFGTSEERKLSASSLSLVKTIEEISSAKKVCLVPLYSTTICGLPPGPWTTCQHPEYRKLCSAQQFSQFGH